MLLPKGKDRGLPSKHQARKQLISMGFTAANKARTEFIKDGDLYATIEADPVRKQHGEYLIRYYRSV